MTREHATDELRELRFHQHHGEIISEAFARPATPIAAPTAVTRLSVAVQASDATARDPTDHLAGLCAQIGATPPEPHVRHCVIEAGAWSLVWERHTEFVSFTVIVPGAPDMTWSGTALDAMPEGWLAELPGAVVSATHMALLESRDDPPSLDGARAAFGHDDFTGMLSSQAPVAVAADFRPDDQGFVRMIVFSGGAGASFLGRLAQRLLEIDFYRLVALLSLPVARSLSRDVTTLEDELTQCLASLTGADTTAPDAEILDGLSAIAGRIEQLEHDTRYRFDAGRAYYQIVGDRTDRLREVRIEGRQRISMFMEHRLAPAMRTCEASQRRLQSLAERVERAISLLSTRVSVSIERQNADQLEKLNARSAAQLRLQQTVEGLSTIAISYYGVGLVQYALKALEGAGGPDIVAIGTGIAIPLVLITVFAIVRGIRKRVTHTPTA